MLGVSNQFKGRSVEFGSQLAAVAVPSAPESTGVVGALDQVVLLVDTCNMASVFVLRLQPQDKPSACVLGSWVIVGDAGVIKVCVTPKP